jgi:FkbM family methyltransferase
MVEFIDGINNMKKNIIMSYAQNFEDIMLWRCFKNIKNGFYIDVGAYSSDYHSVTKLFYDNGWSGINIEPNKDLCDQLKNKRPRDTSLCFALGEKTKVENINIFKNSGLSTINNDFAENHKVFNISMHREEIRVVPLTYIWEKYFLNDKDVHFLKIDVEGYEKNVIIGNDWNKNRPWVIIIESMLPMTQVECHMEWEDFILNSRYTFAYADGLNRFYLANERKYLLDNFKYPPNVFDNFCFGSDFVLG